MKLKTLKDFRREWNEVIKDRDGKIINLINLVNEEELKEEAIKWVKEDREEFGVTFQGEFWQHRLNITEEDLK